MTSTEIKFDKKQNFESIKSIIEKEFSNLKIYKSGKGTSINIYFTFDYKTINIHCYFCKHNKIFHDDGNIEKCSCLASDRPNEIKTEAFKIIAQYFDCKFWENDCSEDNFEIFKTENHNAKRK